jgi:hypothetical protein
MKKIQTALAAGAALSTVLVAAPAFAQFGMLGALASARANTGGANAATSAMANAQAQAQAAAAAQAAAFSPVGLPPAAALVAPTPVAGNTGKYMSPYTAAGEPAAWVAKAQGSAAGAVGGAVGNYVGDKVADKVAEQATAKLATMVPVPGLGLLAGRAAKAATSAAAKGVTQAAVGGGEAFIKSSSDLSFNSVQDLAIYLYVNHSSRPDYAAALAATAAVYPDFQASYLPAVQSASLK